MLKTIIRQCLAPCLLLCATFLAHAQPTTYVATSTGNYTSFTNHGACNTSPCQNFTNAMSVSGSFTTAAPLPANLLSFNVAPLLTSYHFSDGLTTYSSADANARILYFQVTTNGSGAIIGTRITLERWLTGALTHSVGDRISYIGGGTAYHNILCTSVATSPAGIADSCNVVLSDPNTSTARPFTLTWAIAPAVAPAAAPAAIPTLSQWGVVLLSLVVGVLALRQWRPSARLVRHRGRL